MSDSKSTFIVELPFGPPPILPDIKDELREYIECPERLPIHQIENVQCYWPREPDILSLLSFDLAPIGMMLKFDRDPITGKIGDMQEVALRGAGKTARNSMSMNRAPAPPTEGVRGSASNIPFWPGGFDEPELTGSSSVIDIDFEKNMRTLAKGFKSGIEFQSDNCTPRDTEIEKSLIKPAIENVTKEADTINLMAMVREEENLLGLWSKSPAPETNAPESVVASSKTTSSEMDQITMDLLNEPSLPILMISEKPKPLSMHTEWAEMLDVSVPVNDFEKRLPDPAFTYPYELDTFQKQAILKLEEGCNVFVAAHTSAGKTTVAEYAIALSQRHMTRTIYTSPIKALSNQKYRDFKKTFESVGLITGDLQINQTASCLIMTTEILQSMLYCASEVLRDLEYVIFDEVHYINNEDRGHVWEEIVILLPPNVNIVMLSATVPNPLIFANWIGRIKQRKVYVISTLKRPVPLQHYLYTGSDGRTRDNRFLVMDASGQFLMDGWAQAKYAKNPDKKNVKQIGKEGWKGERKANLTPNQEKTMWVAFLDHLKRKNKLPVVAFTLSTKRCNQNAEALRSVDLTTATEKSQIKSFFNQCIKRLKGSDKELPQVLRMQELLLQGVGIHHSGILPILKEIVEMLFQSGVVKLLFATETFAMGVNMPARTVVFDSIRKFDGNNFRLLYPAEYIQMAGRSGRRSLDQTGTVIIMCKTEVPHYTQLKLMMCGEPQHLESQFKVTYSMILNLRRLSESVTVESMMRRSFKEVSLITNEKTYKTELEKLEKVLVVMPELTESQKKLSEFYDCAIEYLEEWKQLRPFMFATKKAIKNLTPGRVLIISHADHYNKLGLLLEVVQRSQDTQYRLLILKNSEESNSNEAKGVSKSENWFKIIALTKKQLFVPEGIPSHEILTVPASDVLEITSAVIKVDCAIVLNDWKKREIARFKNDPPSPTFQTAVHELIELSLNASVNPSVLQPFVEMKLSHPELVSRMKYLAKLKTFENIRCMDITNLESQFEEVYARRELERKKGQLKFKLSNEGLSLYPEYVNKVAVLKELRYIDTDERVALKGRVALEMGTHELLITELVFRNVLTALQPAEIAALLSALVFQQKLATQPDDVLSLKEGCEIMMSVWSEISMVEQKHGVEPIEPLNFGLVKVVYEWARAEPFAKIMELTDVQEGIIVRCIQQLNETLRDVKNAAVIIGDPVLKEKMEEASTAIKRDIVFTASLYTQD